MIKVSRKHKTTIFCALLLAVILSFVYQWVPNGAFDGYLFDICLALSVVMVLWFLKMSQTDGLNGFWLKPSYLFVIGFLAVNIQFLLDYRLGLKTSQSQYILYPAVFNHCMLLATMGLAAFTAGYVAYSPTKTTKKPKSGKPSGDDTALYVFVQVVTFFLFVSSINLVTFLSGADYGTADHSMTYYFENLLYACNAIVIINAIKGAEIKNFKQYLKRIPFVSLTIIILYMLMRLLSGDRGPFIYTALLLIFGYLYATRYKIRMTVLVVAGFVGVLFISLVGIARSLDTNFSFSTRMGQAYDSYSTGGRFEGSKSVMPATEELGFSFTVNQVAVNAVEEKGEKLHYGAYQVIQVLNSVPFMPSFLANNLHIKPEDRSSSGFANYHFFGGYERNYGIGTTLLSDFYLDLGVIGVILGLFLAGMLLKYMDCVLLLRNKKTIGTFALLLVLLFSAKAIYMPRSVLLIDLQSFVLGSILIYINRLTFARK